MMEAINGMVIEDISDTEEAIEDAIVEEAIADSIAVAEETNGEITYYLDYSIDECFGLTQSHLRKYGYENRFYFVTTFLLREQFINHIDMNNLMGITTSQLLSIKRRLEIRYKDLHIFYEFDDTGYSLEEYLTALFTSFRYPMSIPNGDLPLYWELCCKFHEKTHTSGVIEDELIDLRPKIIR